MTLQSFSDVRKGIRDKLLTICDNVEEVVIDPASRAEQESNFPYITFVFGEAELQSQRVTQDLTIIGFVKGTTGSSSEVMDKAIELKDKIFNVLYNTDPKIIFESQDLTNLLSPFGIEAAFMDPIFGGVRFECKVADVIRSQ